MLTKYMYRFFLLFIVFNLLTLGAFATEYSFSRGPNKRMIITSSSCEKLSALAQAIQFWKKRLNEKTSKLPKAYEDTKTKECKIDVSDNTPEFVKTYHGKSPGEAWGNCYGTAFAAAGMIPYFTDTVSFGEDIEQWLEADLCMKVEFGKQQPGDIGTFRGTGMPMPDYPHGFVTVADGVVFSKNSRESSDPFALQSFEEMVQSAVSKSMTCLQLVNNESVKGCPFTVEYYDCVTRDELNQKLGKEISKEYAEADKALRSFEKMVDDRAFHADANNKKDPKLVEFRKPFRPKIQLLYEQAFKKMDDPELPDEERKLWKLLYHRAASLGDFM
jgi:hypothetical protein